MYTPAPFFDELGVLAACVLDFAAVFCWVVIVLSMD
jgi:hypothetical protein